MTQFQVSRLLRFVGKSKSEGKVLITGMEMKSAFVVGPTSCSSVSFYEKMAVVPFSQRSVSLSAAVVRFSAKRNALRFVYLVTSTFVFSASVVIL